jgi:hypothetical protein
MATNISTHSRDDGDATLRNSVFDSASSVPAGCSGPRGAHWTPANRADDRNGVAAKPPSPLRSISSGQTGIGWRFAAGPEGAPLGPATRSTGNFQTALLGRIIPVSIPAACSCARSSSPWTHFGGSLFGSLRLLFVLLEPLSNRFPPAPKGANGRNDSRRLILSLSMAFISGESIGSFPQDKNG